jgi:hypothetical protein
MLFILPLLRVVGPEDYINNNCWDMKGNRCIQPGIFWDYEKEHLKYEEQWIEELEERGGGY